MHCSNCGAKNKINNNFCDKCGKSLEEEKNKVAIDNNKKANVLCTTSLVCLLFIIITTIVNSTSYFQENIFTAILNALTMLAMVAGIVMIVFVRTKCPENKFGKIVMIIYIIFYTLVCILVIYSLIQCIEGIHDSGCY